MNSIKKSFKIYMIVIGICAVVLVSGSVYIFSRIGADIPDDRTLSEQATAEARQFAQNHNTKECISETLTKITPCKIYDYSCRISGKIFLKECLASARELPDFCNAFPRGDEDAKTGKWRINFCLDHREVHNIVCTNTFLEAESYCDAKNKKTK